MKTTIVLVLGGLAVAVLSSCRDKAESAPPTPTTVDATATAGGTTTAQPAPAVPPGVSHATLKYAGADRTYRLFIPAGTPPPGGWPLVVGLHGGLGSGDQFAANSRFEATAASEGFVAVFPDGLQNTWNGGGCCGFASRTKVDDVGFLAALIQDLEARLPVDKDRVLMTGHSNGAIMAFRFGCERADLAKAIAPVAGSLEVPDCRPSRGVSLLAIHGDSDQNHPIGGGQGPRSIAGVPFTSMEATLGLWAHGMTCPGGTYTTYDGALTTTEWSACRDGARMRYVVIAGADHPWPGSTPNPLNPNQGEVTQALDATEAIWKFFSELE
jgi:polyhydroxybutyrate depolymerase